MKTFRESNRRIENSPSLLLEQGRIEREVSVLTGVFTTLKQQLEMIKIEEVKDAESLVVIDYPNVPLHRSSPKKTRTILIFSFIGFILAIFYVGFVKYINNLDISEKNKLKEAWRLLFANLFSLSKK